jgi:hypothetical protein
MRHVRPGLRHPLSLAIPAALAAVAALLVPALGRAEPETARVVSGEVVQIGKASADLARRSVTVPGRVCLREGRLAYLAVAERGKTHESLFALDVAPRDLHVALLLLGLRPEALAPADRPGADRAAALRPGDELRLTAAWQVEGTRVETPVEQLLLDRSTGETLKYNLWIYTGSPLPEPLLARQTGLPLVALWHDPLALVNSRSSRVNPYRGADLGIEALTDRLPPVDTPVELTLASTRPAPAASPQAQASPEAPPPAQTPGTPEAAAGTPASSTPDPTATPEASPRDEPAGAPTPAETPTQSSTPGPASEEGSPTPASPTVTAETPAPVPPEPTPVPPEPTPVPPEPETPTPVPPAPETPTPEPTPVPPTPVPPEPTPTPVPPEPTPVPPAPETPTPVPPEPTPPVPPTLGPTIFPPGTPVPPWPTFAPTPPEPVTPYPMPTLAPTLEPVPPPDDGAD